MCIIFFNFTHLQQGIGIRGSAANINEQVLVICVGLSGQLQERCELLHAELLRGNSSSLPGWLQGLQLLLGYNGGRLARGVRRLGEWLHTIAQKRIKGRVLGTILNERTFSVYSLLGSSWLKTGLPKLLRRKGVLIFKVQGGLMASVFN